MTVACRIRPLSRNHVLHYLQPVREQNENIGSRHAVRLDQLRGWHVLTAVCGTCKRRAQMRLWQLTARNPGHVHLINLEAKLVCRQCGSRKGNRVYVTLASRE